MLQRIDELIESSKNISGNIAHDLKKPLAKLKGNLELASVKVINKKSREYIEDAIIEADNLIKIFNALLDIASFESEKKQDFQIFNLSMSIKSLIEIYSPVFEDNDIEFKSNIQENIELVGNKILLTQAFTNILDNAIKYTVNKKKTIQISLIKNNNLISLYFKDNGEGIDENDYSKVFDRFVRLEKHRQTDGNGLGLSMVKAVIKLHKSTILLSNNNPGLVVEIKLISNS
jgi:signal transduction histidine kinase